MKKLIILILFIPTAILAQLDDFCSGDKGEPIFSETFGDAFTIADPTAIGNTTYMYVDNTRPNDGYYTISSEFDWFVSWFTTMDHTEGDTRGKALIVNADKNQAGIFFERQISGLCPGTTYEFSAWMLNITSLVKSDFCTVRTGIPGGIPINVRFEIWDETDTIRLKFGDTGDIFAKTQAIWEQYGLTFQSIAGQESVILKIFNNGEGGCGNDLALDDIQFASCGDNTRIDTTLNSPSPAQFCDGEPGAVMLTVIPDFSVFSTHFYQWQRSFDGIVYTDIPGAINQTFTTENLSDEGDYYYRVKIAETASNLLNISCSAVSDEYLIQLRDREIVPITARSVTFCKTDEMRLEATPANINHTLRWYNQASGGSVLFEGNTFDLGVLESGNYNYYVESYEAEFDCPSQRIPISLTVFDALDNLKNETLLICPEERVVLKSSFDTPPYQWSTGEVTREIIVSKEGEYTVGVINSDGCPGVERFKVIEKVKSAVIKEIKSIEDQIVIVPQYIGSYEYSLDGISYQDAPVFVDNKTGNYTAYIRDFSSCNTSDQKDFFHLNIPSFFSPNGDGFRDALIINEVKKVEIFNRYGRLIIQSIGGINWDGTQNGQVLASDSYWYLIETENRGTFKGHFLLKR